MTLKLLRNQILHGIEFLFSIISKMLLGVDYSLTSQIFTVLKATFFSTKNFWSLKLSLFLEWYFERNLMLRFSGDLLSRLNLKTGVKTNLVFSYHVIGQIVLTYPQGSIRSFLTMIEFMSRTYRICHIVSRFYKLGQTYISYDIAVTEQGTPGTSCRCDPIETSNTAPLDVLVTRITLRKVQHSLHR